MSTVYKFKGSEVTLSGSANTVALATAVRLVNPTTNVHTITIANANAVTQAVFTILAPGEMIVQKQPTDTMVVNSGSDVKAAPVAFAN